MINTPGKPNEVREKQHLPVLKGVLEYFKIIHNILSPKGIEQYLCKIPDDTFHFLEREEQKDLQKMCEEGIKIIALFNITATVGAEMLRSLDPEKYTVFDLKTITNQNKVIKTLKEINNSCTKVGKTGVVIINLAKFMDEPDEVKGEEDFEKLIHPNVILIPTLRRTTQPHNKTKIEKHTAIWGTITYRRINKSTITMLLDFLLAMDLIRQSTREAFTNDMIYKLCMFQDVPLYMIEDCIFHMNKIKKNQPKALETLIENITKRFMEKNQPLTKNW